MSDNFCISFCTLVQIIPLVCVSLLTYKPFAFFEFIEFPGINLTSEFKE